MRRNSTGSVAGLQATFIEKVGELTSGQREWTENLAASLGDRTIDATGIGKMLRVDRAPVTVFVVVSEGELLLAGADSSGRVDGFDLSRLYCERQPDRVRFRMPSGESWDLLLDDASDLGAATTSAGRTWPRESPQRPLLADGGRLVVGEDVLLRFRGDDFSVLAEGQQVVATERSSRPTAIGNSLMSVAAVEETVDVLEYSVAINRPVSTARGQVDVRG
jgi:hypothetical protein